MTDWAKKKPSEQIPKRHTPDPQGDGSAWRANRSHSWFDPNATQEENERACSLWRQGEVAAGRGWYDARGRFIHRETPEDYGRSTTTAIEL